MHEQNSGPALMAWKSRQCKKCTDFLFSFASVAIFGSSLGLFIAGCQPFLFCSGPSMPYIVIRTRFERGRAQADVHPLLICEVDCCETACTIVVTAGSIQAAASEQVRVLRAQGMPRA